MIQEIDGYVNTEEALKSTLVQRKIAVKDEYGNDDPKKAAMIAFEQN